MKDKTYALTATYDGAIPENTIERKQRNMVAEPIGIAQRGRGEPAEQQIEARTDGKTNAATTVNKNSMVAEPIIHNAPHGYNSGSVKECIKAPTLTSHSWEHNHGIVEPQKVGEAGNGGQGNRVYSVDGKAVTQQANSGGVGSNTGLYAIPVEFDGERPKKAISLTDGKEHTVYEVKDGIITIKGKQYPIKLPDGYYTIRKLTVSECMRLQTVPEWYEFPVSNSQAYKMLGNGWTVEVIAHLIRACLNDKATAIE